MLTGRLFQILGAATANARDAVTVLVLGCCNRCLAEERSGRIEAEFCMSFFLRMMCVGPISIKFIPTAWRRQH